MCLIIFVKYFVIYLHYFHIFIILFNIYLYLLMKMEKIKKEMVSYHWLKNKKRDKRKWIMLELFWLVGYWVGEENRKEKGEVGAFLQIRRVVGKNWKKKRREIWEKKKKRRRRETIHFENSKITISHWFWKSIAPIERRDQEELRGTWIFQNGEVLREIASNENLNFIASKVHH